MLIFIAIIYLIGLFGLIRSNLSILILFATINLILATVCLIINPDHHYSYHYYDNGLPSSKLSHNFVASIAFILTSTLTIIYVVIQYFHRRYSKFNGSNKNNSQQIIRQRILRQSSNNDNNHYYHLVGQNNDNESDNDNEDDDAQNLFGNKKPKKPCTIIVDIVDSNDLDNDDGCHRTSLLQNSEHSNKSLSTTTTLGNFRSIL